MSRSRSLFAAVLAAASLAAAAPTGARENEGLLAKKRLSLAGARRIVGAAEEAARRRGVGVVVVVVDESGHVVELSRMDAAQVASVDVGIGKARTAAIYRRPSRVFEEQIANGRIAALALAGATPLQGGVPVVVDGEVVGAVGVSGDSPQVDEEIALAGARAFAEPEPERATASAPSPAAADPLEAYPDNYRVLFENERVRVLDFRLAKGASEKPHAHPAHVAVFLADFTIRFTLPDGSTRMRNARFGEIAYSPGAIHASENVGNTDAHGILVELKSEAPAPLAGAVTAFTRIHGTAGNEADLERHLVSLAEPTRAEAGCLRYDLYREAGRPHEFLRHEIWSDAAALEAHKSTPHLRASFEKRRREGWTTEVTLFERVADGRAAAGSPSVEIERLDPRLDAIVPPGAAVDRVADGIGWAEGPAWDASAGALLFSDVRGNSILRWRPDDGVATFLAPSGYLGKTPFAGREPGSNGLALDAAGRLLVCQHGERRVVRRELGGALTVLADRYAGRRLNSPNDVVVRPDGAVYFTDPPFGLPASFDDPAKELPFQGVFRLAPDGALAAVVEDLRAPNGLAFSPDGKTLYVSNAESERPVWMAYDVRDDGTVGRGRVFADALAYVKPGEGVPDGMKVDRLGNLFAAGPGGVHVFAPDGARLGRIVTGVPTANVAWGEDGGTLFVAANHEILRLRTATAGATP